jgi:hypothetical protein
VTGRIAGAVEWPLSRPRPRNNVRTIGSATNFWTGEMPRVGPASALFIERHLVPELRAWRGELSLAAAFWIYGVFVSAELVMLHAIALYLDQIWVQQVVILVFALYTPWILVAIWRCADNATPFWATMVRWLNVAWALNTAFILLFLQFDLLWRYMQG